ncbi:MAG: molybdopterin-dependent oxidoreductase [Oscillospiraceae bacterium]|jgi:CO/xanthine dehydrogenase Mo-binding subunit|nr:molybdopterin-dependent oxidoreductase [Oscillospiraceae bacterium]
MPDFAGANGQRETFRVVGRANLPGKLSYALASGVAKFGIDYVLPDMLHARFLRSPYANARIKSVDTAAAKRVPRVVDVLTWDDPEIAALESNGESFGQKRAWLDDYADFEGAEVGVIVVATDEDACEEALKLLEVEWDVLPFQTDLQKSRLGDAAVIRPPAPPAPPSPFAPPANNPPRRGNVSYSFQIEGDVDAGFREASRVIEYDLYMPSFASHMPNPSGSVAWWFDDPYNSGGGQSLHIEGAVREKKAVGDMYGLPTEKVVQEGLFMGGKYCDWGLRKSQEVTPMLARRYGRPVRCVNTREETFDFIMKERYMRMRIGYTDEGLITAVDDYSVADGGSTGSSSFGNTGDQRYGPYYTLKCKNISQRMEIVDSNRGMMFVSGQHCPFNWDAVTIAIHLIADDLGLDPIDVARLNLHGPESQDDINPVPSFERCVEKGREVMNWNWHKSGAKTLPDGRKHGASFRYQMCPRHSFTDYTCKLELRGGRVHMPTQGPLFGVFAVEVNAMVVAEELGLEYDDVAIDFDYREAFTPVGGGSDGTTASAWCMKECANLLKAKILEAAIADAAKPPAFFFPGMPVPEPSPLKDRTPDELDLAGGRIVLKAEPERGVPLSSLAENVFATFKGRPPTAVWASDMGRRLDTMNTAYCEVAVDEETGEVEILKLGVVADPGKVMRPTSLESQIDQVMYFSQGCQLLEDYVFDPRTGVRLNNNMIDYKKPGVLDVPDVTREFLETRAGNAAYGANGISHSLANTHLIIIAIYNALGIWVAPPATPDKVLAALERSRVQV